MMALGAFFAAVFVSVVLDIQEQRHRIDLEHEYKDIGWPEPPKGGGVTRSTAIIHIILGICLLAVGVAGAYAYYLIRSIDEPIRGEYLAALFCAVGVALVTSGVKAVTFHRRHRLSA